MRAGVGVCDVSTLGKIDLQGADAAEFLDRLYTNTWTTLAVGKARYGLMLREDGLVLDDGTTSRLADDRFIVTTTTANAAKVLQHMEFCHQWLWPELDVQLSSVTEQWAQFSVAGPRSRDVLRRVVDRQHDISNAAFPYHGRWRGHRHGRRCRRACSASPSPASWPTRSPCPPAMATRCGGRSWMRASEFGITPYGTEALGVMRIEKGHVAGNEINGQTTARDLGLGKLLSTRKDYVGRVMAQRPGLLAADRPTLVGFKPVDRKERLQGRRPLHPRGRGARPPATTRAT